MKKAPVVVFLHYFVCVGKGEGCEDVLSILLYFPFMIGRHATAFHAILPWILWAQNYSTNSKNRDCREAN